MASFVIEHRVLAGISFEDLATGGPVTIPLHVRGVVGARRVQVRANRRNIYVIVSADGLESHIESFRTAPSTPAVGSISVELEVRDPSGTYLPRQFTVALPRTSNRALPDSVFEPVRVQLLRSPRASRSRNWAMLRVRLLAGASVEPVVAALLRVVHDPDGAREILGWGMSVIADPSAREIERQTKARERWVHFGDRHIGEASVPIVGLSGQIWGTSDDDDVVLNNIPATLEVLPMAVPAAGRLPDPDDYFTTAVTPGNSLDITLSVGGDVHAEPFSVHL
jgi:hypothetical protein